MNEFITFLIVDNYTGDSYYLTGISGVSGGKSSTITQYSTPSGKKISDHLYINPRQLSFNLSTSRIAMQPNKKILQNGTVDTTFSSVASIKDTLTTWLEEGHRLTITTFEDKYDNMVLYDIKVNEDYNGIGAWSPALSFREVRIATPEYVVLPFALSNREKASGNAEQNLGTDNGTGWSIAGEILGGVGSGALVGAGLGSFLGPVGTTVGTILGGITGLFRALTK